MFAFERRLIASTDPSSFSDDRTFIKTCLSNAVLLIMRSSHVIKSSTTLPATLAFDGYDLGRMQHLLKFASYVAAILQRLSINLSLHRTGLNALLKLEFRDLMDSIIDKFFSPAHLNHFDFNKSVFKIDREVIIIFFSFSPPPPLMRMVAVYQVHPAAHQGASRAQCKHDGEA